MINFLFGFLISFIIAGLISPVVMKTTRKLKASQTILHYVEKHQIKQGTPTMGGIIFILSAILASIFVLQKDFTLAVVCLASMLAYGILGFLDDYIKIKYKQNEGLKAYQKIIGQVGLAILFAWFAYKSSLIGTSVYVPFTHALWDLGWFYVPFCVFVFIAVTNSVNLLDGLDGLAGGVSFVYLIGFVAIFTLVMGGTGVAPSFIAEQENLMSVSACLAGGILAFLLLNGHPASIFMGDTGSLALGGFISALGITSRFVLYIPILGVIYVVTALSDIIQVLHYKRTKNRVFLMAPLHHHFEKKGMNENKIVIVYIVITIITSVVTYLTALISGV